MTISERIAELREYARQDSEMFTVGQALSYPHQECEEIAGEVPFPNRLCSPPPSYAVVPSRSARLVYPWQGPFLRGANCERSDRGFYPTTIKKCFTLLKRDFDVFSGH